MSVSAVQTNTPIASGGLKRPPDSTSGESQGTPRFLWPREHGAWGMVLLPFFSAWVLARNSAWPVVAALGAVLATFLIREPLLVLLRQRYRWTQPRAETPAARRSLAMLGPILSLSGVGLAVSLPIRPLIFLGSIAVVLMGLYLWGALNNRQRSPWLQAAGAVGLGASAPLCYLGAGLDFDRTVILLWATHVVHSTAAVLVVHARLDAVMAHRRGTPLVVPRPACRVAQAGGIVFAFAVAFAGYPLLGGAAAFPVAVHALDLRRLNDPSFLSIPLRRVGLRELSISVVFSALTVVGLW